MEFKHTIEGLFIGRKRNTEPIQKKKSITDKEREIRKKIAEKVRKIRKGESRKGSSFYIIDRSSRDYQYYFEGLRFFFHYVRSLKTKVVIDIGAGITKAINEISKSSLGEGIEFKATVLTRKKEIQENLGFDKVVSTSLETLRGIKDESVGGILLGFSLPYVADPEYALKSLDRVLVPGGVLKAFVQENGINNDEYVQDGRNFHSYEPFKDLLEKMGYDCAVSINKKTLAVCILAIKPGSTTDIKASVLLDKDKNDLDFFNERIFH